MIVFELVFSGKLNEEYLREMLMTTGDRYSEEQVDELLREAPIDANGDFDYIEVHRRRFSVSNIFFSLSRFSKTGKWIRTRTESRWSNSNKKKKDNFFHLHRFVTNFIELL